MSRKRSSKHRHDSDSDSSDSSKEKSQSKRSGSSASGKSRQRTSPGHSQTESPDRRRREDEKGRKASKDSARSRHDDEDRPSTYHHRSESDRSRDRGSNLRDGDRTQRAREDSGKREKGRENRELKENPRFSQERRRDGDRQWQRDDSRLDRPQKERRNGREEMGREKSPSRKSRDIDNTSQSRSKHDQAGEKEDKHAGKGAKKNSSSRELKRGKESHDDRDEYESHKRHSEKGSKETDDKHDKNRKHRTSKRKESTYDSSGSSEDDSDSSSEEEESSSLKVSSRKPETVKSPSDKEKTAKERVKGRSKDIEPKRSGTALDNKERERRDKRQREAKSESSDSSTDEKEKKMKRQGQRKEDESRKNKKGKGSIKNSVKADKRILQDSSHEESEEEKHGSAPEKVKTSEIKKHLDEGEGISDDDGEEPEKDEEEEKEEGEISEEEEDVSRRPLIAIAEDISEISTDEDDASMKEDAKEDSKVTVSKSGAEEPVASKKSPEGPSKQKSAPPTKPKEKEENKTRVSKPQETSLKDLRKEDETEAPVSSKEKERPVLESESEEEDPKGLRSHVQSKCLVGSSVSVVNKRRDRPRERSHSQSRERSRNGDGDRGWRRRDDRRSPGPGTKSHRDMDKGRKDKATEGKQSQESGAKTEDAGSKTAKDSSTKEDEKATKKPSAIDILTRTGGAYIPPAKLRMLQAQITDKTSEAYQRMSWEALKKSINGQINKVNVPNIIEIIKELFQENIVRGRGLLARSVIQAQAASPTFTHVYAALVAVINTKFPQNGELILKRLVLTFKRGFRRNDKAMCISSTRFVAHLINQQVAHEVLALEILTLLLESPTDDSVEVSIGFLKECGQKLTEVSSRAINSIFERLRNVLHEGSLDTRVQYMIEVMFAVRKDGFKDFVAVMSELDLVEEEEQFTHLIQLEDAVNGEEILNVFKVDPNFAENEEKYKSLKREILEEGSSDEGSSGSSGSESSSSEDEAEDEEGGEKKQIIDQTETNLVALRRTIYLTVQSSLDHNECAHKILKRGIKEGEEIELCNMILDCCAQLRTYEQFFGLLAQRFCQIDKKYVGPFQQIFQEQYETIHRLETNKIRNISKLFAHLLYTDAISWGVLSIVKLTESDTTSASRIFLKILFQELSEFMGILKLNDRLKDPTLQPYFEGVMPRNNHNDTRFAINFFTTIGLGGLTDDLREHLKAFAKQMMQKKQEEEAKAMQQAPKSSSSSEESDSSSSDSSESSSSESEESSPERKKRKKKTSSKKRKSEEKSKNRKEDESKKKKKSKKEGSKSKENLQKGKSIADRLLDMAQYGNMRNRMREELTSSKDGWNDKDSQRNKEPAQRPDKNEDEYVRRQSGDRRRLDSDDHDPRRNDRRDNKGQGDQRERHYSENEERERMFNRLDSRQDRHLNERADRGRGRRNFNQDRDPWSNRGRAERNWNDQGRMQRGRNDREERGQRSDERWRGQDNRRQDDSGWRDLNDDRGLENDRRWRDGPRMGRDRDSREERDGNSRARPGEAFERRNASRDGKENIDRFDRRQKRGRSPDYDNDSGIRQGKKGRQEIENGRGEHRDSGSRKRSISNQDLSDIESDEESPIKGRKRPRESKHKTSSKPSPKKQKKSRSSSHSSDSSSSSSADSSESSSSAASSSSEEEEEAPGEKRIIKRKVGGTSSHDHPQFSSDLKQKQSRGHNERRERDDEGVRNRRKK